VGGIFPEAFHEATEADAVGPAQTVAACDAVGAASWTITWSVNTAWVACAWFMSVLRRGDCLPVGPRKNAVCLRHTLCCAVGKPWA
jgi:hypothetical protein